MKIRDSNESNQIWMARKDFVNNLMTFSKEELQIKI
jgi:hypothetical protein